MAKLLVCLGLTAVDALVLAVLHFGLGIDLVWSAALALFMNQNFLMTTVVERRIR